MKLNLILSILFAIVTSFSAIHEVEHLVHDDSSPCLVCTVNHNLVSADAIDYAQNIEIVHFEKISQENLVSNIHAEILITRNRAPPLAS